MGVKGAGRALGGAGQEGWVAQQAGSGDIWLKDRFKLAHTPRESARA